MPSTPAASTSRQLTLRTVMRTALEAGEVSRAALARETGLSKQTMSEVFRELEEDGWIEVTGRTQGAVGRSAATYGVAARRALAFGADVGGTQIRAALADMRGAIVAEASESTDPRGGDHVIEQIASLSRTLAAEAGVPADRLLVGTIGIPGAFDPRARRLSMVPNIPGLEGEDFHDRLSAGVGFEVHIDNDVNMAAKGEQWRGEGQGLSSFVFIALGTGIGMGVIHAGRIVRGARGAAGEISTLPVGGDPFDSRGFASGTLEAAVGSAAIRERYRGLGGDASLDVRGIFDRAGEGDAKASATLDSVARILAAAILAVCAVVDPERVIFGGSIGARPELLERVRHHLPGCMPDPPECAISRLQSRAGLVGTVAYGLERLKQSLFAPDALDRASGARTAAGMR